MSVRRPGLVVAVAILLSLPMAPGILDGAISGTTALLRFLVALLLCWAGAALVGSVVRRYNEQARRAEVIRMLESARQKAAEQRHPPATGASPAAPAGTPAPPPGTPAAGGKLAAGPAPASPTPGTPGTTGTAPAGTAPAGPPGSSTLG